MAGAWFPCYANDLLGSMRWKCMTPAQRGAYWQLICWQMQAEDGHLPADVRELSILADLELIGENGKVVEAFPVDETGKRANPRALREWTARGSLIEKRKDIGSAGGRASAAAKAAAKAQPIAQPIGAPNGSPKSNTTTTTTTTTDHNQKPQTEKRATKVALPYRWDDLESVYPADKMLPDKRAKAWWKRHVKDGDDLLVDDILSGARSWTESRQYQEGFGFGIHRFLDEGIWKRMPAEDRHPVSKDQQVAAFNRRTTEYFARQQGIEVDSVFGGFKDD